MFRISDLKTELTGLIGFRDSVDADYPPIDTDITASASGAYFNDFHPILTTEILEACAPQFKGYDKYSATAEYDLAARVMVDDIAWQSKVAENTGHTPAVGEYWETMFSLWLRERVNASVANLFNRLATEKKINISTKAIFENKQLFLGSGLLSDTITPTSRFVGMVIQPKNINNIRITIDKIGLQFTQAQTDLYIYLFNSQSNTYIKRQAISTTTANKFEWVTLTDFNIDFVDYDTDIDSGSLWYIGYFEDDITGNAINKAYSWVEGPCRGCPGSLPEYSLWNLWSKYYSVRPIQFTTINGENLPKTDSYPMLSFGMNLAMTVKPDVTDILRTNKAVFTYPLGLQFAVDMLNWIAYNPPRRTNPLHGNIQAGAILYDVNGENGQGGLKKELANAIKALDFDFSNISTALPNHRPGPIRYSAI